MPKKRKKRKKLTRKLAKKSKKLSRKLSNMYIYPIKNGFAVRIRVKGRTIYVGYDRTLKEAKKIRDNWLRKNSKSRYVNIYGLLHHR